MISTPIRFALCAIAAAGLSAEAVARGQTVVAGQAYSRGVQAYFSGRDGDADQELLEATADDANDPRPHYFRALTLQREGRVDEARGEMMLGAALEAQSPGRYPVGRSLERVQGGNRLQLETFRREARTQDASLVIERQVVQAHAEQNALRDLRGQRTKVSVPLDQLTSTSSIDDFVVGPNRSRSGWAADRTAVPAAATAPAETLPDPFVDDAPQPAAAPAESPEADPFAPSPSASAAPAAESTAESGSKVSSGKLLGILGRVITRSAQANMPLLDEVGNKIPLPPGAGPGVMPPGPQMTPEAEFGTAPAAEDPFAEAPQQP